MTKITITPRSPRARGVAAEIERLLRTRLITWSDEDGGYVATRYMPYSKSLIITARTV